MYKNTDSLILFILSVICGLILGMCGGLIVVLSMQNEPSLAEPQPCPNQMEIFGHEQETYHSA